MRIVKIKKKSGKLRTIYIPDAQEKSRLRSINGTIARKAARMSPEGVVHGFTRHKSPVTNAQAHAGHAYTTCFDLADFFDSVTPRHVEGKLKQEEIDLVFVDGAARQGLPTSPAVANIAAAAMDKAILAWREKQDLQFVYTRYADDLSFSYDDPTITEILKRDIPQIVGRIGFKINPDKTRTMSSKNGRRVITGIAVDETIHPTRRVKRRLRAALHQKNDASARGLAEWCKLKLPQEKADTSQELGNEIEKLQKVWRLPKMALTKLPDKLPEEDIGNNCIITPDPIYMLGMSNWTTGWRSCMRHPDGQYRKGVVFWTFLRGARIAAYLSNDTMTVGGVERRKMRARVITLEMRNGAKVFVRFYPEGGEDAKHLEQQLRAAGYISVYEFRRKYHGGPVVGHAPARWKAYFDQGVTSAVSKASNGQWKGQEVRVVHV